MSQLTYELLPAPIPREGWTNQSTRRQVSLNLLVTLDNITMLHLFGKLRYLTQPRVRRCLTLLKLTLGLIGNGAFGNIPQGRGGNRRYLSKDHIGRAIASSYLRAEAVYFTLPASLAEWDRSARSRRSSTKAICSELPLFAATTLERSELTGSQDHYYSDTRNGRISRSRVLVDEGGRELREMGCLAILRVKPLASIHCVQNESLTNMFLLPH